MFMENMAIVLGILFFTGLACAAFLASPYEIHFEDVEGVDGIDEL